MEVLNRNEEIHPAQKERAGKYISLSRAVRKQKLSLSLLKTSDLMNLHLLSVSNVN